MTLLDALLVHFVVIPVGVTLIMSPVCLAVYLRNREN